ncbi:hypothetical protein Tco_1075657 [Tanacetum coccineum]
MDVNQYTWVPNGTVSLMPMGSHGSDTSMNMGYNRHNSASNNISNSQYLGAPRQQPDQQTRQLPLQLGGRLKGQSNVFKTPQILDFLGESWEEGTLFDVLGPFYKLPRLEEYSNKSDEDLSAVKIEPLAMFSGTKWNIIITEGATGSNEQISKGFKRNGDNTTKDEFNEPPEFHFHDNNSDGREESS